MSKINAENTKPELLVRRYLHGKGLRYRLHVRSLPGKPDIVLPKYKTVIFIHGCFWHGHEGCKYFVAPKTKTEWWLKKIGDNKVRDNNVLDSFRGLGWNIITIWECELKPQVREFTLALLLKNLYNMG